LDRFYILALQGLHALTSGWRAHLPPNAEVLPDLPPVEWLVIHDAQCVYENITVEALLILHPYLPAARALAALHSLAQKKLLEVAPGDTFHYSKRTLDQVQNTERAMLTFAERNSVLTREQAERLAVLMTAMTDMIAYGPNPMPTPVFALVNRRLTPSEHPLGQVEQRLISLLAARDDAHIAAWRSKGYSPAAIRAATYLFAHSRPASIDQFLESPLFYDKAYLQLGLDELVSVQDVQKANETYALTVNGLARCEAVEALTDENFGAVFERRLSEAGRKHWTTLMTLLGEGSKATTHQPPSGATTSNVPSPQSPKERTTQTAIPVVTPESAPASGTKTTP
jgi:hypothetical protein